MPSVFLFYLALGGALQTAAISEVQVAVRSEIVWAPCGDADANARGGRPGRAGTARGPGSIPRV